MKEIKVVLKGNGQGLLMNSPHGMMEEPQAKKKKVKYDHKEEAEKVAYRNKKGQLIVPSRCIKACILNASSWYKFGKKSAKQIIAGNTRIDPVDPVLRDSKGKVLKKYEIDLRPVVVNRSRIIRARPLIENWELHFTIIYNDNIIGNTDVIRDILEEAGNRIGLLDNRPQKYGENGTFTVKTFELI